MSWVIGLVMLASFVAGAFGMWIAMNLGKAFGRAEPFETKPSVPRVVLKSDAEQSAIYDSLIEDSAKATHEAMLERQARANG